MADKKAKYVCSTCGGFLEVHENTLIKYDVDEFTGELYIGEPINEIGGYEVICVSCREKQPLNVDWGDWDKEPYVIL